MMVLPVSFVGEDLDDLQPCMVPIITMTSESVRTAIKRNLEKSLLVERP